MASLFRFMVLRKNFFTLHILHRGYYNYVRTTSNSASVPVCNERETTVNGTLTPEKKAHLNYPTKIKFFRFIVKEKHQLQFQKLARLPLFYKIVYYYAVNLMQKMHKIKGKI